MKAIALWILGVYKRWISPALPPSCRYVPTCSEYAMEAVGRYGVLRGGTMAAWRLLRCHPFVKGGFDPVVKESGLDSILSSLARPDAPGRPSTHVLESTRRESCEHCCTRWTGEDASSYVSN